MPLMTLPGMRERTMRIGSAGKTFSLTGWKVGYVTAPAELMKPIAKAHQFMTFTTPPNLQRGAAAGLRQDDGYFSGAGRRHAAQARPAGAARWRDIGFDVLPAHGTYFITTDFRPLGFNGTTRRSAATSPWRPGSRPSRSAPSTTRRSGRRATSPASASASTTQHWTAPSTGLADISAAESAAIN